MILVRYFMKRKMIMGFTLFYIVVYAYQVNFSIPKPTRNNQDEDTAFEQVKNDRVVEHEQTFLRNMVKAKNELYYLSFGKSTETLTDNFNDRQIDIAHHVRRNEDRGHEQTKSEDDTKLEKEIAQKQTKIQTTTHKELGNERETFKLINESKTDTNNESGFVPGYDQHKGSCEPEIIQAGLDYRLAKKIWKYKIVQWMPYQRKVVDGKLVDTSIGEFWQIDNCLVVDHLDVENADAVVIPVMSLNPDKQFPPSKQYPPIESTNKSQIRILLHSDHPYFISITKEWKASALDNYFNWTMSYRSNSDVHVPYGYSFQKETPTSSNRNYAIGKTKMASAMISGYHSPNFRLAYIKELGRYIEVDMYGRHGRPCDGHYIESCKLLKDYKFYLAFENSNCMEYVTEKMWLNGFDNNAVPVVMGASKEFYTAIAPPSSFIHVDDFQTPEELAQYLLYLERNDTAYNEYFKWKDTHDYCYNLLHLSMQPWRAICRKLNEFKGVHRVYKTMGSYLDPGYQCEDANWKPNFVQSVHNKNK